MRKRSPPPTTTPPTGKLFLCAWLVALLVNAGQFSARTCGLQEKAPAGASANATARKTEPNTPQTSSDPQIPTKDGQTVRLQSSLIQLNVFVTNKEGQPVTNLGREDFEVLENGRPQKITGFGLEVFDVSSQRNKSDADGESNSTPEVSRQDRAILILVDDLHLAPENFAQARKALINFIDYEIRDDDQVAIVSTSGSLGFLQQLTTERRVMRLALSRLGPRAMQVVTMADRPIRSTYQAELILRNDREVIEAAIAEFLAENPFMPPEQARRIIEGTAQRVIQYSENVALGSIETITNAIRNLQRLQGSKLAILVSDGFLVSTANRQARDRMLHVIDAATRASVVIHSIDSRGLVADNDDISQSSGLFTPQSININHRLTSGDRQSRQDTLVAIARETGGTAFTNNNDLRFGLQNVLQNNNVYYSLAYMASQDESNRKEDFRKIEVKVKGSPEVKVRFQRGYAIQPLLAKKKDGKEKAEPTPQQQIQQALGSIAPVQNVRLTARTNFVSLSEKGPVAITGVIIDAKSLMLRPDEKLHRGQIDLVLLCYDSDGKLVHDVAKTYQLNLRPETYRMVMEAGIQYVDYWNPAPGLYQIRVAVRDYGTGKVGTTTQWLDVPDLTAKKLALSDIFFLAERRLNPVPSVSDPDVASPAGSTTPAQIDPRLLVPAWRQFEKGASINFGLFVYHSPEGANNEFVVQIQLMHNNTPVFTSPLRLISKEERVDSERIFYGSRLSLEGLSPGKYFLNVIVIDRTSRERASGRIDFSVI